MGSGGREGGVSGGFFGSCSESKLLDGESPCVTVDTELEGDVLDPLLVPE
jgi:hypothetical protein